MQLYSQHKQLAESVSLADQRTISTTLAGKRVNKSEFPIVAVVNELPPFLLTNLGAPLSQSQHVEQVRPDHKVNPNPKPNATPTVLMRFRGFGLR